jgi:ABC-type multidrug transport system ATPase subunit
MLARERSRLSPSSTTHLHVRVGAREAVFGTALGELAVGSGRSCLVRVGGPLVADRHLLLRPVDGGWRAEADGHPVFLDGEPVHDVLVDRPIDLRLGDEVSGPLLTLAPASEPTGDATIDFAGPLPATDPDTPVVAFPLTGAVLRIGRDPSSDAVVDDVLVSRRHAEIRRLPEGGYEAVDLGSHNGTFVNGRRTERAVLDEFDVVMIGRNSYRLVGDRLEEYVDSGEVAYAAVDLTSRLSDGTVVLDGISFSLDSRSLLAIVGPSGAGKSTLMNALAGLRMAAEGDVLYDQRSLYEDFDALRRRIGHVPQDDIVHGELTLRAALGYAADLRFPADASDEERRTRVLDVMAELGLSERADVRIDQLSGGERKRASLALEMLTEPSLLFLDEPTSGLDPNYERSLMEIFRRLADGGRTVVVVTHAVQSLRLCDRVLVLAPGGRLAYFGPPQLILAYFDLPDMATVFRDLGERSEVDWGRRFREHEYHGDYVERRAARRAGEPPAAARTHVASGVRWKQFTTLTRRYAAVLASDRRNLALLLAQAPLLGLLMLVALPSDELAPVPSSQLRLISEASLVLLVLVLGVSWLGMSNAVREIAKEMPIFRRERAAGLSIPAYVGSKAVVLGALTVVQVTVLVLLATSRQHGPADAVLLGWPLGELIVVGAAAALAAMAAGLLVSAAARTTSRATTMLPIVLVFLLVLALGGVLPEIGDKPVVKQLGYAASTQWGFSGMASTSDLNDLQAVTGVLTRVPSVEVDDPTGLFREFRRNRSGEGSWDHTASAWLGDVGALLALMLAALVATGLALRRDDARRRAR